MKKSVFSILFGLSALAVLLGALFKIMHFDGAMILLVSGFIVGSVIEFIYSLSQAKRIKQLESQTGAKRQESDALKKPLINILFILSTLVVLGGAYMTIMHFPGAYIVLFLGFFVGAVISSYDNKMKTKRIKELEDQLKAKSE